MDNVTASAIIRAAAAELGQAPDLQPDPNEWGWATDWQDDVHGNPPSSDDEADRRAYIGRVM